MNRYTEAVVQCPECFKQQTVTDFRVRSCPGKDARTVMQFRCFMCDKTMEPWMDEDSVGRLRAELARAEAGE